MNLPDCILQFELNNEYSLLVNPLNGAIDITPSDLEDKTTLAERGYFFQEPERIRQLQELQIINDQHNRYIPYWFYVLTTLNCNFACPICYEKETLTNAEMSAETAQAVISAITEFQERHSIPSERINLVLFGGDPLTLRRPEVIHQFIRASSEQG